MYICSITVDPVGEHYVMNIQQIKWYAILPLVLDINASVILDELHLTIYFFVGFTTIWHLLKCPSMC